MDHKPKATDESDDPDYVYLARTQMETILNPNEMKEDLFLSSI